ncbi:MAG TPA: pullulanase [Candidatus Kurthia intestinigallinarum]|nr:pullulanase [Candidatus Kurthia intestinigallinarum]
MNILAYMMDEIKDPTNILEGQRFEFLLDIEVDEEDELYTEGGIDLRVIVSKNDDNIKIENYFFIQKSDQKVLEFGLEDDEEAEVLAFVKQHILAGE